MGFQAYADVPERITGGQLAEEQLDELVPAVESPCPEITVVPGHAFIELIPVDKLEELGENVLT